MTEQEPDFNEFAHARADALSQLEYLMSPPPRRRSHNCIKTTRKPDRVEFSPLPRAPIQRVGSNSALGTLMRTISVTSSCTSEITNAVDKCRKWLVLWWRVTFAPYCWKDETATLSWGKEALEAKLDAAQMRRTLRLERKGRWGVHAPGFRESSAEWSFVRHLPSASPTSRRPASFDFSSDPLNDQSSLSFTSRLALPKVQLTEIEPKSSIRELLEDNVLSLKSTSEQSKKPAMANINVHGWIGRSSKSIDGLLKFQPKSRRNQISQQHGKMHKLLELRATHSRAKILSLMLQDRPMVCSDQHETTSHAHHAILTSELWCGADGANKEVREDVERYVRSRYATQSDGGQELANLLGRSAARVQDPAEQHATEDDNQDSKTPKDENLKGKSISRRSTDRRIQIAQLQAYVDKLPERGKRAQSTASALRESLARLRICWESYCSSANSLEEGEQTLLARHAALTHCSGYSFVTSFEQVDSQVFPKFEHTENRLTDIGLLAYLRQCGQCGSLGR